MELVKKNKSVDQLKSSTILQLPLEADMNVSDSKPDARELVFDRAWVRLEETRPGTNKLWVKGKIQYQILYGTEQEPNSYAGMEGEIPFMEEFYLDGVESQDMVLCNVKLEQYSIKMINSRKWNFHGKILLQPRVQVTAQEDFCIDVKTTDVDQGIRPRLELQKKTVDYLENIVSKKDLARIHEEIRIPNNYGSADEVIWKNVHLNQVSFQVFQEKIVVHGKMQLFLIYKDEREEKRYEYDVMLPFSQTIFCQECQESVIADIAYVVNHEEIGVKENEDGDNRVVQADLVLELEMKLWKKENTQMITSAYGMNCETEVTAKPVHFVQLFQTDSFSQTISKNESIEANVSAVLHDRVSVEVEQCEMEENRMLVKGVVSHHTLLQEKEGGLCQHKLNIPFEAEYQMMGLQKNMFCKAVPQVLDNQVMVKEERELEYMTEVSFQLLVLAACQDESIEEMKIEPMNQDRYDELPGVMVHVVQKDDTLWKLGKEYYMSIDMIKEMNGLTNEEPKVGDKLILMKMI